MGVTSRPVQATLSGFSFRTLRGGTSEPDLQRFRVSIRPGGLDETVLSKPRAVRDRRAAGVSTYRRSEIATLEDSLAMTWRTGTYATHEV